MTFIETVKAMRAAQRTYFRFRDGISLDESKRLEKEVDAAIAEAERVPDLLDNLAEEIRRT
jgi:hypothetical protein